MCHACAKISRELPNDTTLKIWGNGIWTFPFHMNKENQTDPVCIWSTALPLSRTKSNWWLTKLIALILDNSRTFWPEFLLAKVPSQLLGCQLIFVVNNNYHFEMGWFIPYCVGRFHQQRQITILYLNTAIRNVTKHYVTLYLFIKAKHWGIRKTRIYGIMQRLNWSRCLKPSF